MSTRFIAFLGASWTRGSFNLGRRGLFQSRQARAPGISPHSTHRSFCISMDNAQVLYSLLSKTGMLRNSDRPRAEEEEPRMAQGGLGSQETQGGLGSQEQ